MTKGFGPHTLLVSCLADDLGSEIERWRIERSVKPIPTKGNGNVVKKLQKDGDRLRKSGPVVAVIDKDKVGDLLTRAGSPAPGCIGGSVDGFHDKAPGDYELVLLVENVESLVSAALEALGEEPSREKPNPDERDRTLKRVDGTPSYRRAVRDKVPSFDRLVRRVASLLRPPPPP